MLSDWFIFPGRFQPFHNGHDAVVRRFLTCYSDSNLCLGIIFDYTRNDIHGDAYDEESAEHFVPERNPWTTYQRLSAIETYIRSQHSARLLTTLLPRPSRLHSWQIIRSMFPGKRMWVIPACGESWDDRKATFFEDMGDEVLRITAPSEPNGYNIRRAFAEKQYEIVKNLVPLPIWKSLEASL